MLLCLFFDSAYPHHLIQHWIFCLLTVRLWQLTFKIFKKSELGILDSKCSKYPKIWTEFSFLHSCILTTANNTGSSLMKTKRDRWTLAARLMSVWTSKDELIRDYFESVSRVYIPCHQSGMQAVHTSHSCQHNHHQRLFFPWSWSHKSSKVTMHRVCIIFIKLKKYSRGLYTKCIIMLRSHLPLFPGYWIFYRWRYSMICV